MEIVQIRQYSSRSDSKLQWEACKTISAIRPDIMVTLKAQMKVMYFYQFAARTRCKFANYSVIHTGNTISILHKGDTRSGCELLIIDLTGSASGPLALSFPICFPL